MDFLGGYTSEWSVRRVDRDTWEDGDALEGVMSAVIDRERHDGAPLLESGSMELDSADFAEGWHRIYMTATQDGSERHAMATLLFERASGRTEKGSTVLTLKGRSVLQPAADEKLAYGAYAPAGCDGAAYAARLVSSCTPAPVRVEGSFTIVDDFVFDLGTSKLDAAWKLLDAAGWCMHIDGRGEVTVRQKPTEPALELSRANAGLLIPGIDDDFSLVDVPNRYYAIDGDKRAVAENVDPASRASYPSRGRWKDEVDTSPVLIDGESLEHYAQRKLAEISVVERTYSYEREFWPGVTVYSLVRATLAANGIEGDLRVATQRIECSLGAKVTETAVEEVAA